MIWKCLSLNLYLNNYRLTEIFRLIINLLFIINILLLLELTYFNELTYVNVFEGVCCNKTTSSPSNGIIIIINDFSAQMGREEIYRKVTGTKIMHGETSDNRVVMKFVHPNHGG